MILNVTENKILKGVLAIDLEDLFEDHRGEFVETYNKRDFKKAGIDIDFVQDDVSVSYKNVFRGIHGDNQTTKLITCLHGRVYFVVANCNDKSTDFGTWAGYHLSDRNRSLILIPPKYGIGYLALSDKVIYHYKQTSYYEGPEKQFSYQYNDSRFNIKLPIDKPILSIRDGM